MHNPRHRLNVFGKLFDSLLNLLHVNRKLRRLDILAGTLAEFVVVHFNHSRMLYGIQLHPLAARIRCNGRTAESRRSKRAGLPAQPAAPLHAAPLHD
jgi:hypothetical protein